MSGWVKLYRQTTEWEWYSDIKACRLFFHLLITVNHKDTRYSGYSIPRGSRVSGWSKLSEETGLSVQELRTASTKLKSTGEITVKSTVKFSIITVCNYDKYQTHEIDRQQAEQQAEQQASNRRATTSKECKNGRSTTLTTFAPPSVDEVSEYCLERGNQVDPEHFIAYYATRDWKIGTRKMKCWKSAVITWEKRDRGARQQPKSGAIRYQGPIRTTKDALTVQSEEIARVINGSRNGDKEAGGHGGVQLVDPPPRSELRGPTAQNAGRRIP